MKIESLIENGANVTLSINANDLREFLNEVKDQLTPEKTEKYLTRAQVCEILSVDQSTIWRWDKLGYLKAIKIGGKIRYRQSDIDKLLKTDNHESE